MARSRNIKPGFYRDAALVELPVETRLLFPGLWIIADRAGRLEDKPRQIKMEIFPADNFDVNALIQQLHDAGLIIRYEANGIKYIQIKNFEKHQNPHRDEKASSIPAYDEHSVSTVQAPCKHDANRADSFNLIPDSLNLDTKPIYVPAPTAQGLPPCPIGKIVDIYHQELPSLSRVAIVNKTREGYIKQRWRDFYDSGDFQTADEGLEVFRGYFRHVAKSKFLTGKAQNGKGRPFLADFEWLVRPTNFAKVIEGKYHGT